MVHGRDGVLAETAARRYGLIRVRIFLWGVEQKKGDLAASLFDS
jgi:hypothetical protein